MELVAKPYSQSMFEDGAIACCGISTVFAITVNLDETEAHAIPWHVVAQGGAEAWRIWKHQNPTSGRGYCEAYELLQSVPQLRELSTGQGFPEYEIITGYICDEMVDAVAANQQTDEAASAHREDGTFMIKLAHALANKLRPGAGGVIVNQCITIGLWRSLRTPNVYYVFDSHTAFIEADGTRRARVYRFNSVGALLDWYLTDICDVQRLSLSVPSDAFYNNFGTLDHNTLNAWMYSLTCFIPGTRRAATTTTSNSSDVATSANASDIEMSIDRPTSTTTSSSSDSVSAAAAAASMSNVESTRSETSISTDGTTATIGSDNIGKSTSIAAVNHGVSQGSTIIACGPRLSVINTSTSRGYAPTNGNAVSGGSSGGPSSYRPAACGNGTATRRIVPYTSGIQHGLVGGANSSARANASPAYRTLWR